MSRIAIIAALEREINPLVQGWTRIALHRDGREFRCYRRDEITAVAGGIGARAAELAARAAASEFQPQALVSVGLAGALIRTLKVGSVFIPSVIVDAASGAEYRSHAGEVHTGGVLVSAPEIAGKESKKELADRFHALVVDMEAAAVAQIAQELKLGFFCVKAISDELESRLPPMNRFVADDGRFQTGKFLAWSAARPQWWPATARLARDSHRAARALCGWLNKNLPGGAPAPAVVTLDGVDFPKP